MAIETRLNNTVALPAAIQCPIVKLMPARTSLRETEANQERVPAKGIAEGNLAPAIAVRPGAEAAGILREVEEIASATGAHQIQAEAPGAVRSEDLRAAVVRHVPAVRAAPPAWEVGVAVAAADGGGRQVMYKETHMKSKTMNSLLLNTFARLSIVAFICALAQLCSLPAVSQAKPSTPSSGQKTFATSKEAADALIQAAQNFDVPALEQILGAGSEDLVSSEDTVRDKNSSLAFAAKAQEKDSIVVNPKNADRATLVVGNDDWPLPIPILKRNGRWFFDTKAGRQEILYRRIGSNELDAIEICRGYVDAQRDYAQEKHDGSAVNQYAQRVISTSGKHDGLVWRNADGSLGGPIAEKIADALAQGYTDKAQPYHGYFFKILKGQGPAAPLGKMDFVVEGAMIGGFALAAAPADYRVTGVETFIVSYEGVVYQKDLGPDTLRIFKEMELYNPDKSWKATDDNWPNDVSDISTRQEKTALQFVSWFQLPAPYSGGY